MALGLGEETLVDAATPAAAVRLGDAEAVPDQLLLFVDDLGHVAQRPDVESRGVDVVIDAAAAANPGAHTLSGTRGSVESTPESQRHAPPTSRR